jgi:release factor glutamine methyltransferase
MYKSSELIAQFVDSMQDLDGKLVLDMGCGSGIVSIFAANRGAVCLAVDKNHASVECTIENANINGMSKKIRVKQSNLFEKLSTQEKFDFIFINPPYYEKEPLNDFEMAFNAGSDYRVIREFIAESKEYLKENGIIYLIISSDLELHLIAKMFFESGFSFNLLQLKKKFLETFYIANAFTKLQ